MFQALSHPRNKYEGHRIRHDVYRKSSPPRDGVFLFESEFTGWVPDGNGGFLETNIFEIPYTLWGDKGPICVLLHGVPTNREAKMYIQELLSPFCRTIAFDMLGMGEASMPQFYGKNKGMSVFDGKPDDSKAWDWINDVGYIAGMMDELFPDEQFFFQSDDWAGGILSHYIAQRPDEVLGAIWVDPIAFDGYPVSEIQAFGRAAMIPKQDLMDDDGNIIMPDAEFAKLLGSADQSMVQIFKTMVFDPNKYNQYKLRDIKKAYIDTDYERSRSTKGEDANSLTLRLHPIEMRVLTERSAILSPALLLPYDAELNPKGVQFGNFTGEAQVIWGSQDNMMPHAQLWRFKNVLTNANTQLVSVENAGHFAETDQPERVAEAMIDFISRVVGVGEMGDIFLGYKAIWKGDEREMIEGLRREWGIRAESDVPFDESKVGIEFQRAQPRKMRK